MGIRGVFGRSYLCDCVIGRGEVKDDRKWWVVVWLWREFEFGFVVLRDLRESF